MDRDRRPGPACRPRRLLWWQAAAAAAELALPASCGGCGRDGVGWCLGCAARARRTAFAGGPREVAPTPCPDGLPAVWATTPYDGPVRAALVAYKDEGRRDLCGVLAPLLAAALDEAARSDPRLAVPPGGRQRTPAGGAGAVLGSRRAPPRRRAAAAPASTPRCPLSSAPGHGVWVAPALALRRRVADQAGLDSRQRAANLEGAMRVTPRWRAAVAGRCCLLVDDVLTTGATLVEAARALRVGGARHVSAVVVAATQRRHARSRGGRAPPGADSGP